MSDQDNRWRDMIVRERMEVDRQFAERIRQSDFSNQEWNLIMTAVEFEIRGEGEEARLVADTSKIGSIMPELERIRSRGSGPMGGTGASSSGGGLVGSIASKFGLGGGDGKERRAEAEDLADAYAEALHAHLEDSGKWKRIRRTID